MKIITAVILSIMALGCSRAASAQDAERGGLRGACKADFQQYCAGIPAGGASRMQCLEDHRGQLSEGCKVAMNASQAAREACALDAQKYCELSKPGAERQKCMLDNKDKLSEDCRSALSRLPASTE